MAKKKITKRGRPTSNKKLDINKVLDDVLVVFARKGFDGAQIKELAEEAEVNTALLHYHFKDKEDIWKQSVSRLGLKLMDKFQRVESNFKDLDGINLAKAYNRQLIYYSAEFPEFHQIIFHEMCTQTERADWLYEKVLKNLIAQFISKFTPLNSNIEKRKFEAYFLTTIIGTSNTLFTHSFILEKHFGMNSFDKKEVEEYADFINDLIYSKFSLN